MVDQQNQMEEMKEQEPKEKLKNYKTEQQLKVVTF